MIITFDGGINNPVGAVAILAAAEKLGSYPSSFSIGPIIDPMALAAAVPEPEIAPNKAFAKIFVWAKPPGVLPVTILAKLIKRIAIPPLFIIFPARIKNGMANKLNTLIPEKILCAPVTTATFRSITGKIAQTLLIPNATAMGTPAISIITNNTKIINPDKTDKLMLIHPFLSTNQ